jgi:YD repeat-containing protein
LVLRTDDDGGANEGETTPVYDLADYGIGQLESVTGPEGDTKVFAYDLLGRPSTTTTTLPGVSGSFVTGQSFDYAGRTDVITYPASTAYPSGLQVRYDYNDQGYLSEVRNNDTGNQLYWRLDEQTTTSTEFGLGNGISTSLGYDETTGQLTRIVASTFGQAGNIQDLEYAFDTLGNLTRRTDLNRGVQELIDSGTGYDSLNRIVGSSAR